MYLIPVFTVTLCEVENVGIAAMLTIDNDVIITCAGRDYSA